VGLSASSWLGRRVLVTGHTGFKGAWLALWLKELGARVTGLSLAPPTNPSLFELAEVGQHVTHIEADIRNTAALRDAFRACEPEVVFHLAAQSLVRRSYQDPVETFETNVIGTVNVLEAVRQSESVRAAVVVTSDKCYDNQETAIPYRESDPLGGYDPYSSSKACAELVAAAYRKSFFSGRTCIATARAGNVVGGGDFALDRLIPDIIRSIQRGERLVLRNPEAVRPWQHVLEPLAGYLMLANKLFAGERACAAAWNFGPSPADSKPVKWVVERTFALLGEAKNWEERPEPKLHEAALLSLDSTKARTQLGWTPRMHVEQALEWTVRWHKAHRDGRAARESVLEQIRAYASLRS
jgi:CDP-glucose 4,6-dehydratase